MNLLSKFTLVTSVVIMSAQIINPTPAAADSVSSATAAAVSIKFQNSSTTNGFSLNPNGSATGNVNGVQDISAAIATGETKATATTGISGNGTNATSEGYSQPVAFKYNSFSNVTTSLTNVSNINTSYDYAGSTAGMSFIPVAR